MTRTVLAPDEIVSIFTDEFGDAIREVKVKEWAEGVKRKTLYSIWIRLDRAIFKDAVRRLVEIDYPHLGVVSGSDLGDEVELLYHMLIFFGIPNGEIKVTLAVPLPKSDLTIPTISDIIPGAVYTEREKQEMLGVKVEGIPDSRGLFLPEDFPEGVHPWRKDETGIPEDMIKDLWAVGRPTDRPAPPVAPKEEKKPDVPEEQMKSSEKSEEPNEGEKPEKLDEQKAPSKKSDRMEEESAGEASPEESESEGGEDQ